MRVENISESEQFFVSPELPTWVNIKQNFISIISSIVISILSCLQAACGQILALCLSVSVWFQVYDLVIVTETPAAFLLFILNDNLYYTSRLRIFTNLE